MSRKLTEQEKRTISRRMKRMWAAKRKAKAFEERKLLRTERMIARAAKHERKTRSVSAILTDIKPLLKELRSRRDALSTAIDVLQNMSRKQ